MKHLADENPYDEDGNLTPEYWSWWIDEHGAAMSQPLSVLTSEGCAKSELLARLEPLMPALESIAVSTRDLKTRVQEIEAASKAVVWLLGSDIGALVFHDKSKQRRRFTALPSDLEQMKKVLQGLLASKRVTKKRSAQFDNAMDGLIDYVRSATGQFYDEEVSQLVNCVTGREMTAAALKQWRSRRKK